LKTELLHDVNNKQTNKEGSDT